MGVSRLEFNLQKSRTSRLTFLSQWVVNTITTKFFSFFPLSSYKIQYYEMMMVHLSKLVTCFELFGRTLQSEIDTTARFLLDIIISTRFKVVNLLSWRVNIKS